MKKQLLLLSLAGLVTALNFAGQNNDNQSKVGTRTPAFQTVGILGGAGLGAFGAYKSMALGLPRPVRYLAAATAVGTGALLMAQADSCYEKQVLFTKNRCATMNSVYLNVTSQQAWSNRFEATKTQYVNKYNQAKSWMIGFFKKN